MLTPASRSGFPALALVCGLLPIQATQARDKPQDQTISTSVTGPVYANGGAITVDSSGTISGGSTGISGYKTEITTLTNSGTIRGSQSGVGNGRGMIGTLTNSGLIHSEGHGINDHAGTIVTLINTGTISGLSYGIDNGHGAIGVLTNNGLIHSDRHGINNRSGTISTLTNHGRISGLSHGINNDFGVISTLTNSGRISGESHAINNDNGTIGVLTNSGRIVGGSHAINNDGGTIGTLTNSGRIVGGSNAIVNSGIIGALINSGNISGGSHGINNGIGRIGTLTNNGTISGLSHGINSNGGRIETLINSGLIHGVRHGLNNRHSTIMLLTNSGTIHGLGRGISNELATIAALNNSGIIRGDRVGIYNNSTIGSIVNSGIIQGGAYAIYSVEDRIGPVVYSFPTIGPISNTGTISGNIQIQDQDLTIIGGSGTAFGTMTGGRTTISNGNLIFSGNIYLDQDIEVYGGSGTVANHGTLQLVNTHTVNGGFTQTSAGILNIRISGLKVGQYGRMSVSGQAQIDGIIYPIATSLLPGTVTVLTAGNLVSTAKVANTSVFNWHQVVTETSLSLVPSSNFRPQGAALTSTQGSLADYLTRAWNNSDAFLAGQFAAFSQIQNVNQHTSALTTIAGKEHTAQPQSMANSSMAILGSAMSCPVFVAAGTVLGEDSCVWGKVSGGLANAYSNDNDPGYDVSSVITRIGGQKEILPDWFLGGAFGAGQNWLQGSSFSSQGQTYDGSVSLKHTMGPWIIAGSMAIANGSFQNSRLFSLPAVGSIPGSSSLLKSDSSTLLAGGRLRAAYDFAFSDWYVRPYGDVDVVYTHMPSFQESGSGGLPLAFSASDKTSFILSPMVEIGGRHNIDETTILRPFIEFGMSILPDNQRTLNARLVGAAPADGTFTTYSNAPNALGRINLGVQLYQIGGWEVKGEYGIAAGSSYLAQTGSARMAYHF